MGEALLFYRLEQRYVRIESFTFGAGRHACAGRAIATGIAAAGIQALMAHGLDIAALAVPLGYRRAVNNRIPLFGGAS